MTDLPISPPIPPPTTGKSIILKIFIALFILTVPIISYFLLSKLWIKDKSNNSPKSIVKTIKEIVSFGKLKTAPSVSEVTLKPTSEDSLGVDPASAFLLKSSYDLDASSLQNNLTLVPKTDFQLAKISSKEYKIIFPQALSGNKVYQFHLASQDERHYSWAFQTKNKFKIVSTLPRNKATGVPLNTGIEIKFSLDNFTEVTPYFEIIPKVEGLFEKHKTTVVFIPKELKAGQIYQIKIKKGLGVIGSSESLGEDYLFAFETQSPTLTTQTNFTYIYFSKNFYEYTPLDKPAITVNYSSSNKSQQMAKINVYKFRDQDTFLNSLKKRNQIPSWGSFSKTNFRIDTNSLEKVVNFEAPIQHSSYQGYFIFPQEISEGYYLLEETENHQYAWLQITDLAGYLSYSRTKTLVWVNNLKTKQPINQATVMLLNDNVRSSTDNSGIALFDTPQKLIKSEDTNYFIISSPDGKSAVLPVLNSEDYLQHYWSYYDYEGGPSQDYWTYLYFDRELYQPNDILSYWGLIRPRETPKETPKYQLIVSSSDMRNDYQQIPIFEKEITPNSLGNFIGEIPLKNLSPASYLFEIKNGEDIVISKYFTVETYTKPAYQISLKAEKHAVFSGETIKILGKTTFFEGTPLPHIKLVNNYTPKTRIESDNNGEFTITYQFLKHTSSYPNNQYFEVRPENSEESEIEGGTSVLVFGSHINLEAETKYSHPNGIISFSANDIDLERLNNNTAKNSNDFLGAPVTNLRITGKITQNSWEKEEAGEYYDFINKTVSKKYNYFNKKTFLKDFTVVTDSSGKAQYQFATEKDKYYEIAVEIEDQYGNKTNKNIFLYAANYPTERYDQNIYYLNVNNSKEDYKPTSEFSVDEDVRITFKYGQDNLPDGGNNRYLLQFAQRGIREYKLSSSSSNDFPFEDSFIPNIIAKGVYFNGNTYVETESVNLAFKKQDKALTIETQTDKASYGPGDTVDLDLTVKNTKGAGEKAQVNISLVDEAMFKIQEQELRPLEDLYKFLSSGVISSYVSHQYPIQTPQMGGAGGCFLSGTKIKMNGNEIKNIENVKVGDIIQTREGPMLERQVKAKVQKTFIHLVGKYLLINNFLRITPEHILLVNNEWKNAGAIRIGDRLLNDANRWIEVTSIVEISGSFYVYNLQTEKYRTFFADGIYVHNEKGRTLFTDKAYFGSIQTNDSGQGKVTFKLPDNLTSWRASIQAISDSLSAGWVKKPVPVNLPFFIDLVLNKEYLAGDKPQIKIRPFGTNLKPDQEVTLTINTPTLQIADKNMKIKAFETAFLQLPTLPEGIHQIIVSGKAGELEDKIIKEVTVKKSNLVALESDFQKLTSEIKLTGNSDGFTQLRVSDEGKGKFYRTLQKLKYQTGLRVDQKLAQSMSQDLQEKYFSQKNTDKEEFNYLSYQTEDGGISLLPYSSSDLDISSKIAALSCSYFDSEKLKLYFYNLLNQKEESQDRIARAILGLSGCGEPVLSLARTLLAGSDLDVISQLNLGLAVTILGDQDTGSQVLSKAIEKFGEDLKPLYRIKIGTDQDDILEATALTAYLASITDHPKKDALYSYLTQNASTDILVNLEDLMYLTYNLPYANSTPVKFTYVLGDKKEEVTLEKNEVFQLSLSSDNLAKIKFENIQGNAAILTHYEKPLDIGSIKRDETVNLSREYLVEDKKTEVFTENDTVKVVLNYKLSDQALDGCYQVMDLLPSGLKIITRPYSWGNNSQNLAYPFEINNQRVSFCVYKGSSLPLTFLARIISKGEFLSENALIQSLKSTNSINFSNAGSVVIK